MLEQRDLVAEVPDRPERVRHDHDGLAAVLELGELLGAPALELLVADREHLVDEEDVRIHVDRDREAEPHVHARRVVLHRRVDEVLEPGEPDDVVEARVELLLREPEDRAVEVHVVAARQLGVEPGAELQQRRDLALGADASRDSGRRMRAMHLSSVLLPEPFSPMSPNVSPAGISKRDVVERR